MSVRSLFSKGSSDGDAGGRDDEFFGVEAVLTGLAGQKVRSTALHAAFPWVLCGDEMGFVSLHDYQQSMLIFKMQPDLHVASSAHISSAAGKCTRVRLVAFLDTLDAEWRGRIGSEAASGLFHLGQTQAVRSKGCLLPPLWSSPNEQIVAAVTDIALFLIDCSTRRVSQVSAVDAGVINALHIIPCSPAGERRLMIALACADGCIRIIDASTAQLSRELSSGKKKALSFNHLVVYSPGGNLGKGEGSAGTTASLIIVGAASDGLLYLWDVGRSDLPVWSCSAGAQVVGLQLKSGQADKGLLSVHADKTMALWAIDANLSLAEVMRAKPRSLVRFCWVDEAARVSLEPACTPAQAKGASVAYHTIAVVDLGHPRSLVAVAASAKDSNLHLIQWQPGDSTKAANGTHGEAFVVPLACADGDLAAVMTASDSKKLASKFKVYHITPHPMLTGFLSLSTSSGCAVLRLSNSRVNTVPQLCMAPAGNRPNHDAAQESGTGHANQAAAGPPGSGESRSLGPVWALMPVFVGPVQAVAAGGGGLFCLYRCEAEIQQPGEAPACQLLRASGEPLLADALALSSAPPSAHSPALPALCSSPSGAYLLITSWDGAGLAAKASPPKPGRSAMGRGGEEARGCVASYLLDTGTGARGEGRVRLLEKLHGHAVWDSCADRCGWLLQNGAIRVLDLAEEQRREVSIDRPELKGARAVFGGALLSVVLDRGGSGGHAESGTWRDDERELVMLAWDGSVVGGRFACPRDVVWTGDGSAAALLYDSQVVVLANRRGQMQTARVLRVRAQSACWCHASGWECGSRSSGNSLFLCTSDAVLAWNPIMGQAPAVIIASRPHATCDAKAGWDAACLPPPVHPIPSGSLVVLGCVAPPRGRYLVVGVQGLSPRIAALNLAPCEIAGGWGGCSVRPEAGETVRRGGEGLLINSARSSLLVIPQGKARLILMLWRLKLAGVSCVD